MNAGGAANFLLDHPDFTNQIIAATEFTGVYINGIMTGEYDIVVDSEEKDGRHAFYIGYENVSSENHLVEMVLSD